VPAELAGAVTGIVGTFRSEAALALRLPEPRHGAQAIESSERWPSWSKGSGTPASCPDYADPERCSNDFPNPGPPQDFRSFTPDQLRTAYRIEPTGLTGRGRTAVVIEFGQMVAESDIDAYTDGLGLPRLPLHQVLVDDRGLPLDVGFEATLDVETLAGIAPELERLTLLAAYRHTDGAWLTYWPILFSKALDAGMTGGKLTDVVSASWILACEHDLPDFSLVDALEAIFQTAAAAGVTVAVALGDQGSTACVPRTPPFAQTFLSVGYPGSSPWVTSVGATNLLLEHDNDIREIQSWNDWPLQLDRVLKDVGCHTPPCRPQPVWAGGGGRSVVFDRPPWQVGRGVERAGPRQVPDLAFVGDIYPGTLLHLNGRWKGEGNGTSQATPIFAGIALMLNEAGAGAGRPRIGFASPLLYRLATKERRVFVDVVHGNNIIGDNEHRFDVDCCFAHPGYDLTSGWGSLLIDRALDALGSRLIPIARGRRLPVVDGRR
jgi:kumamolisin